MEIPFLTEKYFAQSIKEGPTGFGRMQRVVFIQVLEMAFTSSARRGSSLERFSFPNRQRTFASEVKISKRSISQRGPVCTKSISQAKVTATSDRAPEDGYSRPEAFRARVSTFVATAFARLAPSRRTELT